MDVLRPIKPTPNTPPHTHTYKMSRALSSGIQLNQIWSRGMVETLSSLSHSSAEFLWRGTVSCFAGAPLALVCLICNGVRVKWHPYKSQDPGCFSRV